MRTFTKSKLLLLLLVFAVIVSGCGFGGNTTEPSSQPAPTPSTTTPDTNKTDETKPEVVVPQVLNMSEGTEIPTMDSAQSHDLTSFTVLNNTMEGLYRSGQDHNPILGMAQDHQISGDGLVHTFTLRDAKWSNGDPVTAHDFEFAWKRVLREVGHYNTMFATASVLNAEEIIAEEKSPDELGVKALDDKTLEVTLATANPLFTTLLTFPTFLPVNQKFVEEQGDQYGLEYNTVVYNGPFVLSDWKHDQSWQYKKNDLYWDADNVKLDEINIFVVKDPETNLNLYETGKIDRVGLSAANADFYRDHDDFMTDQLFGVFFLRFNHEHEALKNVNIRRAMSMAFDKEGYTDVILNDGSRPIWSHVPHGFSSSPEGKGFRDLNGDFNRGTVEEAQEYFKKGLDELGIDGFTVNILGGDTDGARKIQEFLQSEFETNLPGVKVELTAVPGQERLARERAVEFDISISNWSPDFNDPITYLDMFVTGGSANRSHYSNPKYDALIDDINKETDLSKRYKMLLEAERILLEEDAAFAPFYQSAQTILHQKKVKGLVMHPTGARYTYKWAYIEE